MKSFITVLIFALIVSFFEMQLITKRNTCLQMDIMILGDFSASITGHEQFVIDAMNAFVKRFDLSETGLKIGAVTFAKDAYLMSPLTSNTEDIKLNIKEWLKSASTSSTNMKDAILIAKDQFDRNGRPLYKKMIIIISDGQPDDSEKVSTLTSLIKEEGTGICGVLIVTNDNNSDYMKSISSDFCYVESSYENLITELLRLDICM